MTEKAKDQLATAAILIGCGVFFVIAVTAFLKTILWFGFQISLALNG